MPCNKEGPLMPTQKLLERKALIVGIVINVLQVLAGMAVFFMTGLKAMFLDFSFTAISVLSGMVAVYLSSRTVRTTERFPMACSHWNLSTRSARPFSPCRCWCIR